MSSADQYVSQCAPHPTSLRQPLAVWCATLLATIFFVGMIAEAPLARAGGHALLSLTIYQVFSHLCHQIPARSFYLAGQPLAACARCTGIYAGFALGLLLYPLTRSLRRTDSPARVWLILAAAPTCIDFALGYFHIWANTHWSRALTGALCGAASASYVVPGLVELSRTNWRELFASTSTTESSLSAATNENLTSVACALSDYSSPSRRIN